MTKPTENGLPSGLRGQCAIITGSGRGIGAATAEELAARGVRVYVCARSEAEVAATVGKIRERFGASSAFGSAVDLERAEAAGELFDLAEAALGQKIQILVNNAAIGFGINFLETSTPEIVKIWDRIQAINSRAPFVLSHEFMRRLRTVNLKGSIVNLGSLGGIRSTDKFPGLTAYVASKFAVAGLTESLAVEGRPIGVRVNAVAPGAVDTEMLRKAAPHLKTNTRPADVAKVIAYLCDTEQSGTVSGSVIEIHSNL
jgi:3-oxoacyl-[acyl-carrier protein] reductase